ncbi:MAG: hypothetical protein M1815_001237 [Lichina confinis]|nr:MAG: hypothetical protein M1815_001237 [Lichina confinis]
MASAARKPRELTNEPKHGAELGTGRVPGSNSRVPEEGRKPIVRRLDEDVFEAFSVCLEAWFNHLLNRRGEVRWDIYLLQCYEVARGVGFYLAEPPDKELFEPEPLTLNELRKRLQSTRPTVNSASPVAQQQLSRPDRKSGADQSQRGNPAMSGLRNVWRIAASYLSPRPTRLELSNFGHLGYIGRGSGLSLRPR